MPLGLSIKPLSRDDTDAVARLWRNHFPPTDPDTDLIAKCAAPDVGDYGGWVLREAGEVVGFALQHYTDTPRALHDIPDHMLTDQIGSDAVFVGAVVHPDYQQHGLGTKLSLRRVQAAQRHDTVTRLVAVAWGPGEHLVDRLGFERVGSITDYYDHDGDADVTVYRRWL